MGYYDWLDLGIPEYQTFLRAEANSLYEEAKEIPKLRQENEAQTRYIDELEKQLSILHKTLDCVYENRCLRRRLHNGRQAHVYQKNNR
jgi:heme oxygenase